MNSKTQQEERSRCHNANIEPLVDAVTKKHIGWVCSECKGLEYAPTPREDGLRERIEEILLPYCSPNIQLGETEDSTGMYMPLVADRLLTLIEEEKKMAEWTGRHKGINAVGEVLKLDIDKKLREAVQLLLTRP